MAEPLDTTLTTYSYVILAIFLLVVILVIRPVKIRLHRRIKIYLTIATVPPLGVLILLICRAINFDVVARGFLGTAGVQPWSVMILFYALAYICISLDMTGVFQFCAFWVARKAGNRGILTFTLFFILTSLMSGLTSNDVVILTGTVFLSYYTRVSGICPTAFMMSEFTTANIASMALYIGNPTNVVVCEAFKINFITYSAWTLLPTVICILLAYITLRIVFRSQDYIPHHVTPPDEDPKSVLVDPKGAIFGLILLACCLITLVATSFVNIPVWMVTLPFACVMLLRDFFYDLGVTFQHLLPTKLQHPKPALTANHDQLVVSDHPADIQLNTLNPSPALHEPNLDKQTTDNTVQLRHNRKEEAVSSISSANTSSTSISVSRSRPMASSIDVEKGKAKKEERNLRMSANDVDDENKLVHRWTKPFYEAYDWFGKRFPTIKAVILRMPWAVLPFSLGMFMLIEAMSEAGWVGIFAIAMAVFAKNYATAVIGMTFVSILACQLLNNIPMTVLFVQIIQHPNFTQHINSDATKQGFLLGLIVGSNLGACLTYLGSLAGVMFDHILRTKGVHTLSYFQFLKWNLFILPVIALGACAVVIGEIWFIYLR
ncbi:Arsenical pump membrane protein [Choanephora cucurbitarum]|uniref:Arsenical pump membrane protein n=1 Tax=Choanephora cucurbitarum TaxID=101091 RepID=A0A1C7NAV4_9FUNG|nr:Arsenical pump membrane protein [Choanephora cucurbitarum]